MFLAYLNQGSSDLQTHFRQKLFSVEVDLFDVKIGSKEQSRKLFYPDNVQENLQQIAQNPQNLQLNLFEVKSLSGTLYQEKRISKSQRKRQEMLQMHLFSLGIADLNFFDVYVLESKMILGKREDW